MKGIVWKYLNTIGTDITEIKGTHISDMYVIHGNGTDLGSLIGNITIWKFKDFSAIQILREIPFGYFEAPKIAVLTIWATMNFKFLETFDIFKLKISTIPKFSNIQSC